MSLFIVKEVKLYARLLIAALPLLYLAGAPLEAQSGLELRAALTRALQSHPRIERERQRLRSARENALFAGRRYPDPEIELARRRGDRRETVYYPALDYQSAQISEDEYRIQQAAPFPGKLSLEGREQSLAAEQGALRLRLEQNNLVGEALQSLIDYQRTEALRKLSEAFVGRSRTLAISVRNRYAGGQGLLADAASAQLREDSYRQRQTQFALEHELHRQRLAYLLVDPPPDAGAHDSYMAMIADGQLGALLAEINERVPADAARIPSLSLEAAIVRLDGRSAGVRRARAWLDYLPDFVVFAGYRRERIEGQYLSLRQERGESYTFGLTIRVPLWSALSNHNRILANAAAESASNDEARDIDARMTASYRGLLAQRDSLALQNDMYQRTILPRARSARDSTMLAYEANRAPFQAVLLAWEELFRFEVESIDLKANQQSTILMLGGLADRLIGETPGVDRNGGDHESH